MTSWRDPQTADVIWRENYAIWGLHLLMSLLSEMASFVGSHETEVLTKT